jgi:hypothetical protein
MVVVLLVGGEGGLNSQDAEDEGRDGEDEGKDILFAVILDIKPLSSTSSPASFARPLRERLVRGVAH